MTLKNTLIRTSMQSILATTAWVARKESLSRLSQLLMNGMAQASIRLKGIRQATSLEDLGAQWQRGFPSSKQVPITDITDTTVFAEIHTPCPLRGTGDVMACYRMMAYDREVVSKAGGRFVVLSSQAEPGNQYCRVAMQRLEQTDSTLVPAHERVRAGVK